MSENYLNIDKNISFHERSLSVWKMIENGELPEMPKSSDEAHFFVNKLRELMEHNVEKYRDKDGRAFYERLEEYIQSIENI